MNIFSIKLVSTLFLQCFVFTLRRVCVSFLSRYFILCGHIKCGFWMHEETGESNSICVWTIAGEEKKEEQEEWPKNNKTPPAWNAPNHLENKLSCAWHVPPSHSSNRFIFYFPVYFDCIVHTCVYKGTHIRAVLRFGCSMWCAQRDSDTILPLTLLSRQ